MAARNEARAAVFRSIRTRWQRSRPCSVSTRAGASPSRVSARRSSTAWDKAKHRAGIEDFRFHDLRHPSASWHVQSWTSLRELMELGGWKSYEMVRYAHLAEEIFGQIRPRRYRSRL